MNYRRFLFLLAFWFGLAVVPAVAQTETDARGVWALLPQPTFDSQKVAVVENVTLERDLAKLDLVSGTLALGPPVHGRVLQAAFRGRGVLRFAPTQPSERQQLQLSSGAVALEAEFSEAILIFSDNTVEELSAEMRFQPGDASGLQQLYRERSDRWRSFGLSWDPRMLKAALDSNPERQSFFVAELKTDKHGWLTFILDAADPEQVELQEFDSARYSVNIWAKFPAGGQKAAEAFQEPLAHQPYQLDSYVLDVTIEGNTQLEAQADVTLSLRRSGQRVLLFALDPNLRVREVSTAAGQPLDFFQPEDPKDAPFFGDYLVVVAPEAFPQGPNVLRFRYGGKRVVRKEGAGTFFCQSFGWYPTYGAGRYSLTTNEFAGRSNFDFTLRVPKKYEAVATGEKVEDRKEDKYRVTRWKSTIPLAVVGFGFGDYRIETQTVDNAQVDVYANRSPDDLLRSAQSAFAGELPGEGGLTLQPGQVLPTAALGVPSPAALAKTVASEVAGSLQVFETYFGDYPYKKLAVANIPAVYSYGQGWPGLLYLWAVSFLDSTQRNALGIKDHVQLTDFFRAHETSHQWWGHAVGWKSYHDQWLSEGFAQFSGILYTGYRRAPGEYFRLLREDRRDLLSKDLNGAVYEQIGPVYGGFRLSSSRHPDAYGVVIYKKGGWVLHMLRMLLYDTRTPDPDHRFKAMMQDFTRSYFNQAASTEDFKRIVEKHMTAQMNLDGNGRMDWFFNQWVYGTGVPHYVFSYTVETGPQPNTYVLRGRIQQSGVSDQFKMPVPVYLWQGKRKLQAGWIIANGPETTFDATLGFKPDKVTLNEMEEVLCTMD